MEIVHIDELPKEEGSGTRGGSWQIRRVFRGDASSPDNFALTVFYQNGTFFSPRHRHNFDQFRYQIAGDADFDINGKMHEGTLGYFPEGARYGPTSGPSHVVAVLQFGGPSGSGYMGARAKSAVAEMRNFGSFEKGVFRRNPGTEGKKNQDSYEAIWEYVNGRELVYPEPQYAAPIMMDTGNFPLANVNGQQDVKERILGDFTSCGIRARQYEVGSGAEFIAHGRGVFLVVQGEGMIDGSTYQKHTAIYLDLGESAKFCPTHDTKIILMGMPAASQMARSGSNLQAAV